MKRSRTTVLLAIAAATAIGGQAVAGGEGPKDFKAIAKIVHTSTKDDTAIFKEKLKVGGKKAGKAKIKLTFGGKVTLSGTWRFDDGTIKVKDKLEGKSDKTAEISRGTGAYKGAEGTVTIKPVSKRRNRETFDFK
jgi:hypothetical protein